MTFAPYLLVCECVLTTKQRKSLTAQIADCANRCDTGNGRRSRRSSNFLAANDGSKWTAGVPINIFTLFSETSQAWFTICDAQLSFPFRPVATPHVQSYRQIVNNYDALGCQVSKRDAFERVDRNGSYSCVLTGNVNASERKYLICCDQSQRSLPRITISRITVE